MLKRPDVFWNGHSRVRYQLLSVRSQRQKHERAAMLASTRRMRISGLSICVCVFALLAFTSACRQDMHDQPKYVPLRESDFFPNHQSARPFVEGTVARGSVPANASSQQTVQPANSATGSPEDLFPFPITQEVLKRGQQRFNIYCAPC